MENDIIQKALHVWRSPFNGNAVIILRPSTHAGYVKVADLDAGERYSVLLDELEVKLRPTEPNDYGFSWSSDPDQDVYDAVKEAYEARKGEAVL